MNSKKWFIDRWKMDDFLILDTETTGLGKFDEVIQLAIINKDGEILFDSLLQPIATISSGAAKVHGITEDMVKDAPTITSVFWDLHNILEGKQIFVYNASFDKRMIKQSLTQARCDDLTTFCTWHDVMKPYARFYGVRGRRGYTWQSLVNACHQQGIKIVDAHSAVGDCQMTLALMKKLAT